MADKRNGGIITLDEFLRERTGFRPGDAPVTCPVCQVEVKGKFCPHCSHEVTAVNYDVIKHALQNRDITHDQFLEGLRQVERFARGEAGSKEVFERKRERRIIYDGED
jgi:hypothetical protein